VEKTIKTNLTATENLNKWFREVFTLPDFALIDLSEEDYIDEEGKLTKKISFKIIIKDKVHNIYTILKPASEVVRDDIDYLKQTMESYVIKNYPIRSKLYKFFGWWIIFAGSITIFSVCPICGQTGCPVGIGTTGILAGIFSLIKTGGKGYLTSIKRFFTKIIKNSDL
jgi:hypothetical protein